jgi:peptidoglycan/xylan/chitin deacetylase (PgdA/CDA1 family)
MKKNIARWIRDLIIWKMSFFGYAFLYRVYHKRKEPLVRVVVFHDIPDRAWFEGMVRTLVTHFHVISPEEFHGRVFDSSRINVLITFDDGYASWGTVGLPVLAQYGCRALFFVSSGLIEASEDTKKVEVFMRERLLIQPRPALSWEGVRTLVREGHTIGGHAYTHADLTTLDGAALAHEIEMDKEVLETALKVPVLDFAYPFGTPRHVHEAGVRAVQNAGYRFGYTATSRFVSPDETFCIPRMCIESEATPRVLIRWMKGAYDLFDMMKKICVR